MQLQPGELLAVITVIMNVGAIFTGAAKLSAATQSLEKITDKLSEIVNSHETRLSRLEGKLNV